MTAERTLTLAGLQPTKEALESLGRISRLAGMSVERAADVFVQAAGPARRFGEALRADEDVTGQY